MTKNPRLGVTAFSGGLGLRKALEAYESKKRWVKDKRKKPLFDSRAFVVEISTLLEEKIVEGEKK